MRRFQPAASGKISVSIRRDTADKTAMIGDQDALRSEIGRGLAEAGLDPTAVSRALGRSKDYVGDFLRGRKATLGYAEIGRIREMIRNAPNERSGAPPSNRSGSRDTTCIHIDLAAFREAVFSTLRTSGVSPVLARSRIDDLLSDLRELSEAHFPPPSAATLRIETGSADQASVGPSEPQTGT